MEEIKRMDDKNLEAIMGLIMFSEKRPKSFFVRYATCSRSRRSSFKVKFICLGCDEKEEVPRDVVEFLDGMDVDDDPFNPPQFTCKKCGEEMYPEYYKNEFGYEFQISDVYP